MEREAMTIRLPADLARRLRLKAAETRESMNAIIERAIRKELGEMANRDEFARTLGYATYDDLMAASEEVAIEGDVSWYITRLPDGRWAAWDDGELATDRVEVRATRDEALAYLWSCWEDSLDNEPETDRVRWLAGVPHGVPTLEEAYRRITNARCDLLDDGGTPLTVVDIGEMGGDTLPVRIMWYNQPEPLIEDDDPPLVHPRWRGTNCNWRSADVPWDERRAKVWGEVAAGGHWFAVVGEADPRA